MGGMGGEGSEGGIAPRRLRCLPSAQAAAPSASSSRAASGPPRREASGRSRSTRRWSRRGAS
eukprot:scaffold59334_cov44-Phaeocystis_antarctica.AAC.2